MRPSSHQGLTHFSYPDEYGYKVTEEEVPVLLCDALGRPPAATGRDRTGQDLPRPLRDDLGADFPKWHLSLMVHHSCYNVIGDKLTQVFTDLHHSLHFDRSNPFKMPRKQGGFLDEYPRWFAALRERLLHLRIETTWLDSWDPRFDDLRFDSLRGGGAPLQVTTNCILPTYGFAT